MFSGAHEQASAHLMATKGSRRAPHDGLRRVTCLQCYMDGWTACAQSWLSACMSYKQSMSECVCEASRVRGFLSPQLPAKGQCHHA